MKFLKSLRVGLKRRWWVGLQAVFAALGLMWLATELGNFILDGLEEWLKERSVAYVLTLFGISVVVFIARIYEPRSVDFTVPTTNTHLTLKYGDMFTEDADLLVAVNEYFDGELGEIVSPESVHGKFIVKYFQSNSALFRAAVDPLLESFVGEDTDRSSTPSTKYPIGTTVRLVIGSRNAFLVAMSNTNVQTHRASTNVANFWTAVTNALESAFHMNNGNPLVLPLIGSGRSAMNLEPQHLLRLLVLSIVDTARKMQLPEDIRIVLPEACFNKLDLREIARAWRY